MLGLATWAMLRGIEPFATWYYAFAWYPTLVAIDSVIALRSGRFLLLGRPAFLGTLLAWSVVVWLFFELLNFRLENWYYVFALRDWWARLAGVVLCFATVLPAVFVSEGMLSALGIARTAHSRPLRVTPSLLRSLQWIGGIALLLTLIWPRFFFPLVWVGPTLLLDAANYRRDPSSSLIGDLERGEPGRVLRLLLGGALIGLLWEIFNAGARSKWIYTVPGFEELKLFEMPLAGFLGFPPFALECYAIWQTLVLWRLAVPRSPVSEGGARRPGTGARRPATRAFAAAALAVAFSLIVIAGLERFTISSYLPRLVDLPTVPAEELSRAGYDAFSLAEAEPDEALAAARRAREKIDRPRSWSVADARRWVAEARLATLRGIGAPNVRRLADAGIDTVEELAAVEPARLRARLGLGSHDRGGEARVRVWVEAAQREVAGRP